MRAAIALGANLGDRAATFEHAVRLVEERVDKIVARSRWRETPPLVLRGDDPADHPSYLNGLILVETSLEPDALLTELHAIERLLGRDRAAEAKRWQPRLLDLDLIALDDLVREHDAPILPHPRLHERLFVLEPLAELWPDWRHPVLGNTSIELLASLRETPQ